MTEKVARMVEVVRCLGWQLMAGSIFAGGLLLYAYWWVENWTMR